MRKNSTKITLILLLVFMLSLSLGNLYTNPNKLNHSILLYPETASNQNWWWEPVELLSPEFSSANFLPDIAIDGDNNIHIVTYSGDPLLSSGSDWDIFYKKYDYQTKSWSTLELVSDGSNTTSQYPAIAVDSTGTAHVVWYDSADLYGAGIDLDILYRQRTSSGWTPIEIVSTESTDNSYNPAITIDSNDTVHVAWDDATDYLFTGSDNDIFYKTRNSSGGWTTTYVVSYTSDIHSYAPSIAVDEQNNVYFAWEDGTNIDGELDIDIFFRKLNIDSQTFTPLSIISSESVDGSFEPKLTNEGGGRIHVCWNDYSDYNDAGSDEDIFYKSYDIGSNSWSLTEVISTESTTFAFQSDIVVDEDNYVYIVWRDDTDIGGVGDDDNIMVKHLDLQNNIWSPYSVLTYDHEGYAGAPKIDVDSMGHIHTIWIDSTDNLLVSGSDTDLFYRKFVGIPGIPTLNEIVPNSASKGDIPLKWPSLRDAEGFTIYRDATYFTSVSGLTPIGFSITDFYTDTIGAPGIYYYAIVAENRYGQSVMSNIEVVTVTGLFSSINLGEVIIISAVVLVTQLLFSLLFRGKKPKSKR